MQRKVRLRSETSRVVASVKGQRGPATPGSDYRVIASAIRARYTLVSRCSLRQTQAATGSWNRTSPRSMDTSDSRAS